MFFNSSSFISNYLLLIFYLLIQVLIINSIPILSYVKRFSASTPGNSSWSFREISAFNNVVPSLGQYWQPSVLLTRKIIPRKFFVNLRKFPESSLWFINNINNFNTYNFLFFNHTSRLLKSDSNL